MKENSQKVEMETLKLKSEDLEFLATFTDVPKDKVQEFYEEFVEEFSDGKITKESYEKVIGTRVSFSSL